MAGFKKAFGSKLPKTDAIDAYVIAERIRFGHLVPFSHQASVTEPLQQLTRLCLHLIELLAGEQNRALNYFSLKFSNYKRDNLFSNNFGKSSLEVLKEFIPDELTEMSIKELTEFVQNHGKDRFSNPDKIASALKQAARRAHHLNHKMQDTLHYLYLKFSLNRIS